VKERNAEFPAQRLREHFKRVCRSPGLCWLAEQRLIWLRRRHTCSSCRSGRTRLTEPRKLKAPMYNKERLRGVGRKQRGRRTNPHQRSSLGLRGIAFCLGFCSRYEPRMRVIWRSRDLRSYRKLWALAQERSAPGWP